MILMIFYDFDYKSGAKDRGYFQIIIQSIDYKKAFDAFLRSEATCTSDYFLTLILTSSLVQLCFFLGGFWERQRASELAIRHALLDLFGGLT